MRCTLIRERVTGWGGNITKRFSDKCSRVVVLSISHQSRSLMRVMDAAEETIADVSL